MRVPRTSTRRRRLHKGEKMNKKLGIPFEEVAMDFTPLVMGMMKRLKIYKNREEYIQIGFIALWKAYQNYDPEKGSFSSFAYSYVRGDMLAQLKKDASYDERHLLNDFDDGMKPVADESRSIQEEYESISAYLKHLTPREMDWVIEHIIYGRSITEIANKYNVAPTTVKSWRKQALKKLRERHMPK